MVALASFAGRGGIRLRGAFGHPQKGMRLFWSILICLFLVDTSLAQLASSGGQTKANESGWTVDTLKAHYDQTIAEADKRYEQRHQASEKALESAFLAQKEAVTAALSAAERAVLKAELAAEKRFESVNEFRSTLADQQRNLIPRSEVEVLMKSMNDKVITLQQEVAENRSKSEGVTGGWGYAIGAIGFIMAVVAFGMRVRTDTYRSKNL